MEENEQKDTGADHRRLKGLVSLLSKTDSLEISKLDFSHPLLANSTMAQIKEAIKIATAEKNDDLCKRYGFLMKEEETFSVGGGQTTEWMPLGKIRYLSFSHCICTNGVSAFVWSPSDCWLVHFRRAPSGITSLAIQSVVSKTPAEYYVMKAMISGGQKKLLRVVGKSPRLPDRRHTAAAISVDMETIMMSLACEDQKLGQKQNLIDYIIKEIK